ncbi:hypothetical protein [Blastopirellula marina]|uniref:Uncharacterized protein n=1 Tax=Blastopirellula marina TaxID=124 RepID=A0A2S8FP36_9BACT|nr:hypothetical protein [Blastopirellula marina]PQO33644.1 hypothetical protein C5Y98_15500 [Blastopirellula marina]PTL43431.1 hypothetical protein C5Y97_15510 [Blastopirellula marina]
MKPPVLYSLVLLLVAVANAATIAQEDNAAPRSKETPIETVSKVDQEPKSYDDMGFEELGEVVRKLEEELKNQTSLGSGGEITEERIRQQQHANELRKQLFKANTALRKKGDEIRQAERSKWMGHLEEVTTKLDEMKRERCGILEKFYQVAKAKYDAGTVGIDVALQAEAELADAEFDLHGRESYKTRMIRLREWQEGIEAAQPREGSWEEDQQKVKARFLKTYIEYLKGTEENYREILKRYP